MPSKPPTDESLLSAKLAHLNMVQTIISRLAGFSASAKNFCVTIIAALAGIAFQQRLPLLLLVAAFVVLMFATLDIYYLAQERRFRTLYQAIADRPLPEARQLDLAPPPLTSRQYWQAARSFSTGGFYLLLLIVTAAILFVAYGRSDQARSDLVGGPARAPVAERPERPGIVGSGPGLSQPAVGAATRNQLAEPPLRPGNGQAERVAAPEPPSAQ